jgi:microcystin-dependent protein
MLPDLRGRVPVGTGAGTGLTDQRLGQRSGTETTTLIQANLPAHQHGIAAYDINSDEDNHEFQHGSKSLISVGNEGKTIIPSNANGANIPVSNMQPSLSINFIICTVGLYPSRN